MKILYIPQCELNASYSKTGEVIKHHACEICHKLFEKSGALRRLILIHTGETPYHCNMCDYKCTQSSSLKKHITTHTGNKTM